MALKAGARAAPPVGLAGLGLMGQGIAACLLAHGFRVVAYNRTASRIQKAGAHIAGTLGEMARRRIIAAAEVRDWRARFQPAATIEELASCDFVIETVREDLALKRRIYDALEACLVPRAIIASNTSSIPIGILQEGRKRPDRFIGMHWGEPAQILRYLEIIPGDQTSKRTLRLTRELGLRCGKAPTVLNYDVRGFISNRLMYAMIREAFHLVETGVADIETVDRSFRNDIGWWAAIAGPFRWMDLTGIQAYAAVMEGLLPELSRDTTVPPLIRKKLKEGAEGVSNAKGFYAYTPGEAARWSKIWTSFSYDLRALLDRYTRQTGL